MGEAHARQHDAQGDQPSHPPTNHVRGGGRDADLLALSALVGDDLVRSVFVYPESGTSDAIHTAVCEPEEHSAEDDHASRRSEDPFQSGVQLRPRRCGHHQAGHADDEGKAYMPPELVLSSPMIHLRSRSSSTLSRLASVCFINSRRLGPSMTEGVRFAVAGDPIDHSLSPLLHALVEHHLESERGMASGSPTLLLAMNRIEDVLAWGYSNAMPDAGPDWTLSCAPMQRFRPRPCWIVRYGGSLQSSHPPTMPILRSHLLAHRHMPRSVRISCTAPLKHQPPACPCICLGAVVPSAS